MGDYFLTANQRDYAVRFSITYPTLTPPVGTIRVIFNGQRSIAITGDPASVTAPCCPPNAFSCTSFTHASWNCHCCAAVQRCEVQGVV